jgi:hypothetical protein
MVLGVLAALGAAAGCTFAELRDSPAPAPPAAVRPATPRPAPTAEAPYLSKVAVVREKPAETPTAVESALAWSEKYAKAMEELARERERNRKLEEENRGLQAEATALKTDLAKAHQELEEANTLLVEVRGENDKWKSDVLGYRDEMRRAHLSELDALAKVLRLLGAELPPAAPDAATKPPAVQPDNSTDSKTKGKPGESAE